MKVKPFTARQVDIRIIDTEIGRVVPVTDIADAVGCDQNILFDILDSDIELYEKWLISIKLSKNKQVKPIKTLNHYGVFSILSEINCFYINDDESRKTLFSLRDWIKQELLSPILAPQNAEKKHSDLLYTTYGVEFIKPDEAAKIMGRSYRMVMRYVKAGKIKAHKVFNGYLLERDSVLILKQQLDNWKQSILDRNTH